MRRKKTLRRTDLAPGAVTQLRTGHDFHRDAYGPCPTDETALVEWLADLRHAWETLREHVLDTHREHCCKGWPSRPWAWWVFDRLADPPHALDPHWAEAARLFDAGELSVEEIAQFRKMLSAELGCRRQRIGLDPPEWVFELESLAQRVGGAA
ncbi:MAG: hypothetical protein WC058_14600 [Phycisphaeraceae bacterium]